jgi:serine/threonine protein kinase/tetratricopeptide (TPR) repeat protein
MPTRQIPPDRWRALSPYLDQALDMAPDARAAWLASLHGLDASVVRDLRALLEEQDVANRSGFLDGAALGPHLAEPPSLAGQVVGAYRLDSLIGQGGSGSVWRASRCDGRFEGQVAVKLLSLALLSRSGEERFRREATILARLRHPGIAHLIDAGVSSTGQPYLVLELVDGDTIEHYATDHALGIDARLRLFLDVLDAVAHAHANLVVHRDIKPANVIVSATGDVKLLDFGIAQLVKSGVDGDDAPGAEVSALTREIRRALTPEYAAPEQLAGGAVTTATDVYALGVLLYVLLAGRHPAGRSVSSPALLFRSIANDEPPRVSEAVVDETLAPDALESHATRCRTTPARLRRLLRGDLDAIVSTALRKDPAQRYGSVTALADDVRRYLAREPIAVRRDHVGYRAARFVRRHAIGVATAAAFLLLVGALTAFHTIRLATERDRAQRESAKAVTVADMFMGLLTSADPYAGGTSAGEPTVRALLDDGADQVRRELADQPDLQAEMLTMMGRTYRRLGAYDKAQLLLEQALASGRIAFGGDHARVAQTLHDLGVVLADRGDYLTAARHLEHALAMRRALIGATHPDVAVTLAELGRVYQDQGFHDRAAPLHLEALAIRTRTLGASHRETAVSQSDVASVLRLNGDLAGAERYLHQCLETNLKTRGARHPNTATTMHDLGLIAAAKGDHAGAESRLRDALAIQREMLGARHPVVASTLNSLAHVMVAQRRPGEAAAALGEALDIVRPALGGDHQLVAIYALNKAAVHLTQGQLAAALPLVQEGLRVRSRAPDVVPTRRRTMPADDWSLAAARLQLGATLRSLGRDSEAEAVLRPS